MKYLKFIAILAVSALLLYTIYFWIMTFANKKLEANYNKGITDTQISVFNQMVNSYQNGKQISIYVTPTTTINFVPEYFLTTSTK